MRKEKEKKRKKEKHKNMKEKKKEKEEREGLVLPNFDFFFPRIKSVPRNLHLCLPP